MAKPKSKKSTQVKGSKMAQKKLIEGVGKISEKVAAKATAAKRKAAPKTAEQSIADIAEQVAAKLAESGTQMAQQAPGGVDKIAELVAARLGQTSNLVQETLAKQVDKIVEFPYPDDWYDDPKMMGPVIDNASELWLKRDHKHDLAFRPLETALLEGKVDAIYTQSKPFQHVQEETGELKAIEDLSRYSDWTLQICNQPTTATCTVEMAEKHPELVVAWLKAMIKVGRWGNEHKHAAASILDKQTFYRDVEDTYRGIKEVDIVPNLSPKNLKAVEIGKDFMLSHGYIKNDFDVHAWAAPEFLEQAATELLQESWKAATEEKLPEPSELLASTRRIG